MKNVQDIYPVSPMQEMMLLHSLAQNNADTLFNQFCFQIDARLDEDAFRLAWLEVVERHDALRTAFIWEGIKEPQQVVRKTVTPSFEALDWRSSPASELEERFDAFLADDRRTGFDFRRAPLMRFSMIRLGPSSWRFVWSSHHLIIDRWCLGQIFSEFDRFYARALQPGEAPGDPPAPSFREYINWINCQDRDAALSYWRAALHGLQRPAGVMADGTHQAVTRGDACVTETRKLAPAMCDELAGFARQLGLTPGVIVQGAWALTLNRIARTQDAVFGAAVAGRPPEIPNIESIVGSFINNVPVRVPMPAETGIAEWLTGIQSAQFQRTAFEYLAPGDVQGCADIAPLFDTLLVWHSGNDLPAKLPMRAMLSQYATAFPLTLSISDRSQAMAFRADCRGECRVPLADLLHEFESSLHTLLRADDQASLGELAGFHRDAEFASAQAGSARAAAVAASPVSADRKSIDGSIRGRERLGIDVVRELLREEWSLVLGKASPDEDADFFEQGGTSLQAVRLHAGIEKSTRQSLPLLALFHEPTIGGMARTLFGEEWPLLSGACIGLRTAGAGNPLFCIASPEVNTVGYALLTRQLPDHQDVYVVQEPPDTCQLHQFDPSILPMIADRYVASIRAIRPAGPYRLLGMCSGSHIALEMARRLEASGDTVEFLGIINTWSLYTVSRLYYLNRLLNIMKYYVDRIWESVPARKLPVTASQGGATDHDAMIDQQAVLPASSATADGNPWINDVGFVRRDPRRPKVRSEVTVFRIKPQPFWRVRDQGLGWSRHAVSVNVVHLSCRDHDAIMRKQHIRQLAASIEERLATRDAPVTREFVSA